MREHIRDPQEMPHGERQSIRATRGIPRGQDALERLTVFEELAGSFLGGRFIRSLEGEHREGYAGLARLREAPRPVGPASPPNTGRRRDAGGPP